MGRIPRELAVLFLVMTASIASACGGADQPKIVPTKATAMIATTTTTTVTITSTTEAPTTTTVPLTPCETTFNTYRRVNSEEAKFDTLRACSSEAEWQAGNARWPIGEDLDSMCARRMNLPAPACVGADQRRMPPTTSPPVTSPPRTSPPATTPPRPSGGGSISQSNALRKAEDYLDTMAFSRKGLIEQLEYEGFSNSDATYGVDHVSVDWNEQAAKKAADYLHNMAFSRSGLVEQLEYEGFTPQQAEYGVSTTGL